MCVGQLKAAKYVDGKVRIVPTRMRPTMLFNITN